MYFRNNEVGKGLPRDTKPTPFPRTTTEQSQVTSTSVNSLNRNCHEFVNEGHHSYDSMSPIKLASTNVNVFSEEETQEMDDDNFSNDLRQRLIL
jgi:hypothetical protein